MLSAGDVLLIAITVGVAIFVVRDFLPKSKNAGQDGSYEEEEK
jgi:hypothetical protein